MSTPILIGGFAFLILLALFGTDAKAAPATSSPGATTKTPTGEKVLKSPLAGVSDSQWTAFVRAMASAPFSFESPKNFFGAFLFGIRRLADLGFVKNPRKNGNLWVADWVKPKEVFLSSPSVQYEALGKSTKAYAAIISRTYSGKIGTMVDGKKVTLSGLLGAAHAAGSQGLGTWLSAPTRRAKYPHVTALFEKTTGIF